MLVVAVAGGTPERLTFHSDGDLLYDWSPDGKYVAYSRGPAKKRLGLIPEIPEELYEASKGYRLTYGAKLMEWAATEQRVLLTHDVTTMTKYAYERTRLRRPRPGVF